MIDARCNWPHGSADWRAMNQDFVDFLTALIAADAGFIVVGARALAEDPHAS